VDEEQAFPVIRQTVLDTADPRRLAEFYRQLFGLQYRPGDEPPGPGRPDPRGQDWLILNSPGGGAVLAFQKVEALPEATWPDGPVAQQLHLDTTVPTTAELDVQHERALALGARLLLDRSDDPEEPLRVYADPAGHPFCIIATIAQVPDALAGNELAGHASPVLLAGPGKRLRPMHSRSVTSCSRWWSRSLRRRSSCRPGASWCRR
jgi:Glyoxalase-like domain